MDERLGTSDSSALCTQCGLCCNGVLFDWVPVAKNEHERVTRCGIPVETTEEGFRFTQPCGKFEHGLCGVYSDRPDACRRFQCELLKRASSGDVSLAEAQEVVARAKEMIDQVAPQIKREAPFCSLGNYWSSIFREWESRTPSLRAEPTRARLVLNLTVLNRFLDLHFRSERKRRVMEE